MKKSTKNIIAGGLAVVGVYLLFKYFRKDRGNQSATPTEPPPPYVPTTDRNDRYPLKKGSRGNNVESVQKLLLGIDSTLLPKFGADGDFGSETEAAVQKVLGKKSVDNSTDYNKLLTLYNQKNFPLLAPNPSQNIGLPIGVPTFKPPFSL